MTTPRQLMASLAAAATLGGCTQYVYQPQEGTHRGEPMVSGQGLGASVSRVLNWRTPEGVDCRSDVLLGAQKSDVPMAVAASSISSQLGMDALTSSTFGNYAHNYVIQDMVTQCGSMLTSKSAALRANPAMVQNANSGYSERPGSPLVCATNAVTISYNGAARPGLITGNAPTFGYTAEANRALVVNKLVVNGQTVEGTTMFCRLNMTKQRFVPTQKTPTPSAPGSYGGLNGY
jgi:hypothetical protein